MPVIPKDLIDKQESGGAHDLQDLSRFGVA